MTSKEIKYIFKNISNNLDNCNNQIQSSMNAMLIGGKQDDKMYKRMKQYKEFVGKSQQSILYFRSLAEYYYRINLLTTAYYQGVAQKLNDMKQKMTGMDSKVQNIANQYQHNSEKIQMLEYFVDMIEKMAKNPTEIDVNVKSNLNNQMLEYATKTSMSLGDAVSNVKRFDLQHGGSEKSFEDLELLINSNAESILNSFSNIEFLNKKMTSLNDRMKQVVESNDSLFKLRAEVEWVVNTLENCSDGTCDKKAVSHNFDKLWKIVNGIQTKIKDGEKFDAEVVKYVNGLEKYVGVLETQLSSADRTVRSLDKKNEEKVTLHTNDLKSNLNAQTGGLLMEEEYKKENANKTIINEDMDLTHIQCKISLDNLENKNYAKVVMLKTVIKTLNDVIAQFYNICSKDAKFYDEQTEFNFMVLWKETFKSKKTSYYLDLLEKTIAYQNDTINAKKFTIPNGEELKIIITIDSPDSLTDMITLLEDTKSFYICANYVTAKYLVGIMIIDQDENALNIEKIESFNVMLKEYGNNLHKATHLTFENFSETYDTQTGGGLPHMHILPQEEIGYIKKIAELTQTYSRESFSMYFEFVNVLKSNPDLKPSDAITEINKSVILKIKTLDESIGSLYEMVVAKLGSNEDYDNLTKDVVATDMDLTTIAEKLGLFKQKENKQSKPLLGGAESKPRLDPYKIQLVTCKESIKSFAGLLINLKEWMKKNSSGKLLKANNTGVNEKYNSVSAQSKLLLQIQKSIDSTVVSGRNSYIKVIPMIFFIVEFPPHIYLNNSVKDFYKFEYSDQKIKYIHHMENGSTDVKEYNGAHAAFFASNNKNGTSYLLKDPLIGLDKIIATTSDQTKPVNKVINMMFALGASGTGKTTRYFGKSDSPDPNDKQGVVNFVIENAKVTGASEVNVAYFVCYGQHDGNVASALNELMIFFNTDKDGNDKYMPYNMNVTNTSSTSGYTDFYIKLMNKKLNKLTYDNVSDFLQGKADRVISQGTEIGSFRKIIEENDDIWMTPATTSEIITKLFEALIGEQKKIYTVMPTKNNIESSRGHTCVLIRFKYDDGTYKYFPLFDMAGTENPTEVADFFTTFKYVSESGKEEILTINKPKLAKLMKQINAAHGESISDDISGKETAMQSLTDLLNKSEKARKYIGGSQAGGGRKIQNLMDFADGDKSELNAENFLAKLGKEGYYINHTIAMLIFAALCVGTSLNTTQVGDVDNFDGFEEELNKELQSNYICLLDKEIGTGCSNTRFILEKYGFAEILSKSCIWTQILFSFLYWNDDTQGSYDNICDQIHKNYTDPNLQNKMSYFIAKPDNVNDTYQLSSFIKDDATYSGAVNLCKVLSNSSISGINVSNGVTFNANKNNYQLVISGNKIIAEKMENDNTVASIYIGARKSGKLLKIPTKPIVSEIGLTEESVNKISTEPNSQKINILTYNMYMLSNILLEIINSEQQSYSNTINSNVKLTNFINKIFIFGQTGKYIDDIHSIIVGGTAGYKEANANDTNIKKLFLFKTIVEKTAVDFLQSKSVVIEKKHVNYLNKLIATISKFIGRDETQTDKKITAYRATQIDQVITSINSANISEDSYKIFLLSQGKSLKETEEMLNNALQFSKQLGLLINNGKKEIAQHADSIQEYNQVKRIKDGSLSATKMTMMHLVTGQTYKTQMVQNTLDLCQVLYNSTDLKL